MSDLLSVLEDLGRGVLPSSVICLVSLLLLMTPVDSVGSAAPAAADLPIYRLHQFDMFGTKYGSRGSILNYEARSTGSSQLNRKCVLARVNELSSGLVRRLVSENVAGLLVLLPPLATMPEDARISLRNLELELWGEELQIPVYFIEEDEQFGDVYEDIRRIERSNDLNSPLQLMRNAIFGNTYHLVAKAAQSKPIDNVEFVAMHGFLHPPAGSDTLGTIVLSAYIDAFGTVPGLVSGWDSNGSGLLILLRLLRTFAAYYAMPNVQPKYSLLFLLPSGGRLSFYGTRRWIEENLEAPDSSALAQVSMALCLDSLGRGPAHNLHVSKIPKDGSLTHQFYNRLRSHAGDSVQFRQKKINLANDWLAWEHERFSIKRLPGLTVSWRDSANDWQRHSVLDQSLSREQLNKNYRLLAKSLIDVVFQFNGTQALRHVYADIDAGEDNYEAYESLLSYGPRSYHRLGRRDPFVVTLGSLVQPLLKEFKMAVFKPEKKDPEVVVYDVPDSLLSVHVVKPALFDLFLACVIGGYLFLAFLLIAYFARIRAACITGLSRRGGRKAEARAT